MQSICFHPHPDVYRQTKDKPSYQEQETYNNEKVCFFCEKKRKFYEFRWFENATWIRFPATCGNNWRVVALWIVALDNERWWWWNLLIVCVRSSIEFLFEKAKSEVDEITPVWILRFNKIVCCSSFWLIEEGTKTI